MGSSSAAGTRVRKGRWPLPVLVALGVLVAVALPAWLLWALGAEEGSADASGVGAEVTVSLTAGPTQMAVAAVVGVTPSSSSLQVTDQSVGANGDLTLQPLGSETGVPLDGAAMAAQPGLEVRITGQVQDEHGALLSDMEVYLLPGNETAEFMGLKDFGELRLEGDLGWMDELSALADLPGTTTDAAGRFDFTVFLPTAAQPIAPGEQDGEHRETTAPATDPVYPRLMTAGAGFVPAVQSCKIREPGAHDAGTAVMRRGGELSGRLIDDQGLPLQGVAVAVSPVTDHWLCPSILRWGRTSGCGSGRWQSNVERDYSSLENQQFAMRTGADGRFTLSGLSPADAGVLRAQLPGMLLGQWPHDPLATGQQLDMGDLQLSSGGALSGRVIDEQGRPIRSATVRLAIQDFAVHDRPGGDERFTIHDRLYVVEDGRPQVGDHGPTMACSLAAEFLVAETDEQGRFALDSLDRKAYGVFAVAPGHEPSAQYDIPVGREGLLLTLQSLGSVHLELVNDDGSPAVAQSVRANRVDMEPPASTWRWGPANSGASVGTVSCVDAEQGLWTVKDLCDLPLQLTVETDGTQRRVRLDGVPLGAAARTERVVLPAPARLRGRTVDHAGQALAGVAVQMFDGSRSLGQTESDDEGTFELPLGSGRDVRCTFRHQAAYQWRSVSALGPGEVHDLGDVRFAGSESVRSVKVLVTDGRGEPLSSVLVGLFQDQEPARREAWHSTSKDGWVTLAATSPGPHLLRLLSPKPYEVLAEMPLTLVLGVPAEVVMVRPDVGEVRGLVMAGGLPVVWAKVTALTGAGRKVETQSDAWGSYQFSLPLAAEVTLVAVSPKGALTEPLALSLAPGDRLQLDLTFGSAALVGRVMDAVTGLPAPTVRVRLGHEDASVSGSVVTNEAGQFRFDDITPGTWSLKTQSSRYAEQTVAVTLAEHDSMAEVTLELEPHGEVVGRVLNSHGDPSPGEYLVFLFGSSPAAGDLALSVTPAQYSEFTLRPKHADAFTLVITPDLPSNLRQTDENGRWQWLWSTVSPFVLARSDLSLGRGESRAVDLVVAPPDH